MTSLGFIQGFSRFQQWLNFLPFNFPKTSINKHILHESGWYCDSESVLQNYQKIRKLNNVIIIIKKLCTVHMLAIGRQHT